MLRVGMVITVQTLPHVFARHEQKTEALRLGHQSRDRAQVVMALVAAALSIASTGYYFRHHLILAYQDSFSHLELSRRFVAGLSPGIAQLGGVWLPVPQVLQSLFSWNYTLYRTGLAGSVVSMASYVAIVVLLYRLIRLYSGKRAWPAIAGALVFAVNVNILYQQSTSMDELPFYAFTTATIYYLARWGATKETTSILVASICSGLAMLCRYEGWFLSVVYVACVLVMGWRFHYSWRDIRGLALVTSVFGLIIPAGGWVIYNYLIFNNPIYFQNGPQSSSAQMAFKHSQGLVINIGNWPLTLKGYFTMLGSDLGLAALALGVIGLIVFVAVERFSARSVPVLGLLLVIPFYLYTLEAGSEPISMPSQPGLLNYRFGLVVAIPIAILTGYLLSKIPGKAMIPAALVVIIGFTGLSAQALRGHQVVLATEASQDLLAQSDQVQVGNFLQHTNGLILMDIVQNERTDYFVVDRTVYDGTKESGRNQWATVLHNPEDFGIKVILMRLPAPGLPSDVVYGALHGSKLLRQDYRLAYSSDGYQVYEARTS
jgi:Dolichyl-phosphate-mannose-protein mannosyltransferase